MSTVIRERDTRAGQDEANVARVGEGAAPIRAAARPWPTPGHQLAARPASSVSQPVAPPISAALPATDQRRGILSGALVLWLVVYTFLNVGDLLSTYFGLQAGLHEANPLMSGLLAQDGFSALIAYKLVVVVAVIGGAIALYRMHPRAAYLTVHVCNGLVFLAVFLNVAQMLMR